MSILNDDYFIDIYINSRKSESECKEIIMYNTDKNIATFKVGVFKEDRVPVEKRDAKTFKAKLTLLRYKTNSAIEIDGKLDTDTDYVVYIFDVPEEYLNQSGKYGCEVTIINGDESITFNHFEYEIKQSILTDLNEEIESNPDLPILKQLIQEVRDLKIQKGGINDEVISDESTWSSVKINSLLDGVQKDAMMFDRDTIANIQAILKKNN